MIIILSQLQFQLQISMAKRQSWSIQEDKLISSLISTFQSENKKIKWAQISSSLRKENPDWTRTGKQCRERWLNHLRPCLDKSEQIDQIDLQQLFQIIRVHGKKWSLIAKQLPGRTDNSIKNFFYAALRKGLRNLNLYNTELRIPRRYKIYKHDLIDKLLSVHDEKKSKDLFISDQSAYQLAQDIRQNFITSSKQELKSLAPLAPELQKFYETLNQDVMQLCRICKFKKSRTKKSDQNGEKYEIFTRKILKNQVKIEQSHVCYQQEKSQITQEKQIKIEQDSLDMGVKKINFTKLYSSQVEMIDQIEDPYFFIPTNVGKNLEMSLVNEQISVPASSNLFEMLSMPEVRYEDNINLLY